MILKVIYIFAALVLGTVLFLFLKFVGIVSNLFLGISIKTTPPDKIKTVGEKVRFPSPDGMELEGMFWRGKHKGRSRGTVVFCHEFGSSGASAILYGEFLLKAGFDLFGFDFRGHGQSDPGHKDYEPRHWATCREVADTRGAIAYLRSRADVRDDGIGLFGVSRGGAAALAAAGQDGGVSAVFCDSAFSTWATLNDYMRRWVSIYAFAPIIYNNLPHWFYTLLGSMGMKVSEMRIGVKFVNLEKELKAYRGAGLFVHGARDSYIRSSQAKYLAGLLQGPSAYQVFPEARHNGSRFIDKERYERVATEFFLKYLCAGEPVGISIQGRGN